MDMDMDARTHTWHDVPLFGETTDLCGSTMHVEELLIRCAGGCMCAVCVLDVSHSIYLLGDSASGRLWDGNVHSGDCQLSIGISRQETDDGRSQIRTRHHHCASKPSPQVRVH